MEYLVKVEDEIQLAHVAKELVQQLHEKVDGFQVCELIVRRVDAKRKKQARVPAIDDLELPILRWAA